MPSGFLSSVATRVTVTLVFSVTLVLLFAGAFLYKNLSDRLWSDFHNELQLSADRLEAGVNLPVWNIDYLQTRRVILSAMKDKSITAVVLKVPQKNDIYYRGDDEAITETNSVDFPMEELFDASREIIGGGDKIGELRLYMTTQYLKDKLRHWALFVATSILLIDALLVLVLYVLLRLSVLNPLKNMEKFAISLQSFDFIEDVTVPSGHRDEFSTVFDALYKMIAQMKVQIKEIGNVNTRFWKMVESFPIALSMYQPKNGTTVLINQRFVEIFGYRLEDIPDVESWLKRAYPDEHYRASVVGGWSGVIDDVSHFHSPANSKEYRVTCKNGDVKTIDIGWVSAGDYVLGIFVDVTERRLAEQAVKAYQDHLEVLVTSRTSELERARDNAEAANRAKSVFLANMSHELRTPLTSVIGFSRIMHDDPDLTEQQRRNIDFINRSGSHLLTLINNILDLSKIESGNVVLSLEAVSLSALVNEVADMLRPRAQQQVIDLVVEFQGLPVSVDTDAPKLKQILLNLVSNAIKFTSAGSVTLRAIGNKNGNCVDIEFLVMDTGIGVGIDDQQRIFEPFVQIENNNSHSGTGLGLAISRQYLEMMGASLQLQSELGKGSIFSFHLTFTISKAAHLQTLPPLDMGGLQRPHYSGCRVLVVDDVAEIRLLVSELLAPMGLAVREAASGEQALECMSEYAPHLLLVDWRMPGLDGLTLTKELRRVQYLDRPAIIMMSAHTFVENQHEALAAGVDDFLPKPIELEKLEALVAKYASRFLVVGESPASQIPAPAAQQESMQIAENLMVREDLNALSADVREQLQQALRELNPVKISAAIDRVATENREMAKQLGNYAGEMRYRELWRLFEILKS